MALTPYAQKVIANKGKSVQVSKLEAIKKGTIKQVLGKNPHTSTIYSSADSYKKNVTPTAKKKANNEAEIIAATTQTEAIQSKQKTILPLARPDLFSQTVKKSTLSKSIVANAYNRELKEVVQNQNQQLSLYGKVDNFLGGYLPFGISPTQSKTIKSQRKANEYPALLQAQKAVSQYQIEEALNKEKTDIAKDLVSKNGLENIGLFRSSEEKAIQDLIAQELFYNQQAQQIPQLAASKNNAQNVASQYGVPIQEFVGSNSGFLGTGVSGTTVAIGAVALIAGIVLLTN